jgi:hypothetical protein
MGGQAMNKRKLLVSLVIVVAAVLSIGVYRLFDGRHERGVRSAREAPVSTAPQVDALSGTAPPISTEAGWRAMVEDLTMVIGPPVDRDSSAGARADDPRFARLGTAFGLAPALADPGNDDWHVRGGKGEGRVDGQRYRSEQPGERTILTSGRRIGAAAIRLPAGAQANLALRDEGSAPVRALVCVNRRGRPTEVRIVDGTGMPEVDASVARELLADRFRPLRMDGERVGFCERVTVVVSS